MLFDLMLLELDLIRLCAEYRLFHAKLSPTPESVEEEEDLRANMRFSMASRCISMLSCPTSSRSEAS
jgi:hypothetical protein